MKTPEQIAEQTVESFEPDDRMSVNDDTYSLGYPLLKDMLVSAIEDYRQNLSLSDARDILDRHDARGAIWSREDIDGELEQRIESGEIPAPSDDDRDRLVDDAMTTKTPYQVAHEYLDESGLDHLDEIDEWGELVSIVAAAIEADRAQRDETGNA